ncbi:MAG: hypothetical protein ABW185_29245, partial [Sedimenticola sp.]
TWDLYLNQALAAVRFNVSVSSKFSPFFLLYNRDVVLPIDNLMKPRRKYQGDDLHQIALQEQHKSFTLVRRHLKKAKKRQAKYADRGTKAIDFEVNDPVYYRNNQRKGKLDIKWKPFYRIIEKKGPLSYVIKNQLDGTTSRVHAELLRAAHIDEWDIPKTADGRPLRKAAYVVPPEDSESEDEGEESDHEDSPLSKVAQKYVRERDNSDDEDNIPLMELAKRLRWRKQRMAEQELGHSEDSDSEDDIQLNKLAKRLKHRKTKSQQDRNTGDGLPPEPEREVETPMDCSHVHVSNEHSDESESDDESVNSSDDCITANEVEVPTGVQRVQSLQNKRRTKKSQKKHELRLKIEQLFQAISDLM